MDQGNSTMMNDPAAAPEQPAVGSTPDLGTTENAELGTPQNGETQLTPEQQRDADEKVAGDRAKQRINDRFKRYTEIIKDKETTIKEKDALIADLIRRGGNVPDAVRGKTEDDPEPKRDDPRWQGLDYEDFLDARTEWKARQEYRRQKAEDDKAREASQREEAVRTDLERTTREHAARVTEYAKSNPEYAALAAKTDLEVDLAIGFMIQRNADGPLLMHELMKQPQLVEQLNGSRNLLEAQELLGRIAGAAKARASQISSAREPGEPVGQKPSSEGEAPEETEAYMKWANKKFGNRPRQW